MSGYLQRIAGSVSHPSQRVHSMVGSLFAPTNREDTAEPGLPLETSSSVAAKTSTDSAVRSLKFDLEPPKSEFSVLLEPGHLEAKPLLSTKDRNDESVPPTTKTSTQNTQDGERSSQPLPARYSPLLPVTEQYPIALQKAPPTASVRRASHSEVPQIAQREPDEIQIHIGRVEVLAVPQTQPQAAPKIARKAGSLDDYLRRRDGRSL